MPLQWAHSFYWDGTGPGFAVEAPAQYPLWALVVLRASGWLLPWWWHPP